MSSELVETRERILETTWRLMEARQGQSVRIEDIAKATGVSRQTIYLHFGSRAELLLATVRYVDEKLRFNERIQEVCAATDGVFGIDEFVTVWANYIPEIHGLAKALLAAKDTDEAAAAAWSDRMNALYGGCVMVLGQLERQGLLASDWAVEEAAALFWASLSVQTWEELTVTRGWSQDQYIDRVQRALKAVFLRTS